MGVRELTLGPWVVDTGPLSHFAKTGYLSVLALLAPHGTLYVPDVVAAELAQAPNARVRAVMTEPWVVEVSIVQDLEIRALADYMRDLDTADGRNIGECGVLAVARVRGWTAVLDDQAACERARADNITVHRSAKLLCDAINARHLTRADGLRIADELLVSGYRLPIAPGEFLTWADDVGLLGT